MTVPSEINKSGPYIGNGVTTSFDFGFKITDETQLVAVLTGDSGDTNLVLGSDYSVTGVGDVGGGSIATTVAPATGEFITLLRSVPFVQETDLQNQGAYYAETVENALDQAVMRDQQLQEQVSRSLKFSEGSDVANVTIQKGGAGKVLGWGADGNIIPVINSAADAELIAAEVREACDESVEAKDDAEAALSLTQAARDAAAGSASSANTDADRAEFAAGNAFVNADVYADIATGLAAVADGEQFQVLSGDEYVRYRRDSASTQTEVGRYPSAEALDPLQRTHEAILAVSDADGNLGLEIQSSFQIDAVGNSETNAFRTSSELGKWLWAIADGDGNIPIGVNDKGQLVANFDLVPNTNTAQSFKTDGLYDYTINHVFCYGQSLSVGQATPVQSAAAKYDSLMFSRGMRPQYDYPSETAAEWYAALVPAVEELSTELIGLGETPSRATADAVKELIASEDGKAYTDHEYRLLLSNPGWGATTVAQLSKGSSHYNRMVAQAEYGLSLANANGDTYAVQAVTWIQGESDYLAGTTQATYLTRLNTLVSDIQTDLKAATGQSKRIAVIGYQVASHITGASDDVPDIALAQLECAETNADFFIATAMYHFPYADGFHLTGSGSRWLGAYLGLAYKRIVIDEVDWSPLRPIAVVRQANILEVRFHVPSGRLEFDTTTVANQPNKGFDLVDSAGDALTISTVEIADFDRVHITAASKIPSGAKLRYAWQGNSAVGLGNLRDTQGDTIIFDPEGSSLPLHNWCVIFERTV